MGVSKNNGTPKWMVKIMEKPIKMDDLGGKPTIYGNTHIPVPWINNETCNCLFLKSRSFYLQIDFIPMVCQKIVKKICSTMALCESFNLEQKYQIGDLLVQRNPTRLGFHPSRNAGVTGFAIITWNNPKKLGETLHHQAPRDKRYLSIFRGPIFPWFQSSSWWTPS